MNNKKYTVTEKQKELHKYQVDIMNFLNRTYARREIIRPNNTGKSILGKAICIKGFRADNESLRVWIDESIHNWCHGISQEFAISLYPKK